MIKLSSSYRKADIDEACENMKSTFKLMHDKLDEEEKDMCSKLQEARTRVKQTGDLTTDDQVMSLASLESVKSCQVKLAARGDDYDYVTATDSLQRDVDIHYSRELPGFVCTTKIAINDQIGEFGYSGNVKIKQSERTEVSQVKVKTVEDEVIKEMGTDEVHEVCLIAQQKQNTSVIGMVIYKQSVYTVQQTGLSVYCYTQNGVFRSKYEDGKKVDIKIGGMCLIMRGNKAKLVISDSSNYALVWISILDDSTMKYHKTQRLEYQPYGSYNDLGELMVCDRRMIHRYSCDDQSLDVLNLPGDVWPWGVAPHDDQYVISDFWNRQIILINKDGQVKRRYKAEIHMVLNWVTHVTSSPAQTEHCYLQIMITIRC